MKLTKIAVIIGVVLGLTIIISGFYSQVYAGDPPASVTIGHLKDKKAPVVYPHKQHDTVVPGFNTKCIICHVSPEGGALVAAATDPAKKGQYDNIYHKEGCLKCHNEEKAKNPATKAPTLCAGCHPEAAK